MRALGVGGRRGEPTVSTVAENGTPKLENSLSPDPTLQRTLACTDCVPISFPNVQLTDACPAASVTTEVVDKLPLPIMSVQLIVSPTAGAPAAVVTATVSGVGRASPGVPNCLSPEAIANCGADAGATIWSLPHALTVATRKTRPTPTGRDITECSIA